MEMKGYCVARYNLDFDLGSDTNFDLAMTWMNDCSSNHESPCTPIQDVILPARVLDVGPADGSRVPKLLETSGLKGQYITLSHCWGDPRGPRPLITTQATLAVRKTAISLEELPASFRDAVVITRRLGFRYLWIDSLCIIQDSRSDWEVQSAQMGSIYQQAALTIAASAAINSHSGLLNFYDPSLEKPVHALFRLRFGEDSEKADISVLPGLEEPVETWASCVRDNPLATRAWAFQERVLSARTLCYGAQQIYWHCRCSHLSADGDYLEDNDLAMQDDWPSLSQLLQYNLSGLDTEERFTNEALYGFWCKLVELYSSRQLTQESDRLPALAGIALLFQQILSDTYIAGLWNQDIAAGLLWVAINKRPFNRAGLVPSWSWISVGGKIKFVWTTGDKQGEEDWL
jgi:Heterokaryon incompatibility protein (HET)